MRVDAHDTRLAHAMARQRLRDDFLRAVERPPRAPAVRTDIVPRPLERDVELDDDFRAVARPPFAPAFRFCAVEPARPPFAPAFRTVIDFRLAVVFRAVVVFFRAVADFVVDFALVFAFALVFVLRAVVRLVVVFFRGEEDAFRDEPEDEDDFASPDCARCLLTVRAAISFERFADRPCFCSESLMCSYCRSRLALHDSGMRCDLLVVSWPANACPERALFMR